MRREPISTPRSGRQYPWIPFLIFFIFSVGIIAVGTRYYRNQVRVIKTDKQQELAAIADLKVRQIVDWLHEREGDALVIQNNSAVARLAKNYLQRKEQAEELNRLLGAICQHYGYASAALYDTRGLIKFIYGDEVSAKIGPTGYKRLLVAMREQRFELSDLHLSEVTQEVTIGFLIPLVLWDEPGHPTVGAIVIRIDPYQILYPLIQSWPTPSRTFETLLVRREGDQVVYLNELRYQKNTALKLKMPLARKNYPAGLAAQGREGVTEGFDYRNVPVLAAMKKVPNTRWALVAMVDQAEIYASLDEHLWIVAFNVLVLIIASGALLGFWWRNRMAVFYRSRYHNLTKRKKMEEALHESERKFRSLAEQSLVGIVVVQDGLLKYVNPKFAGMFGYSVAECLAAMPLQVLIHPEDLGFVQEQVRKRIEEGSTSIHYEARGVKKDGAIITVEVYGSGISFDNRPASIGSVLDVTERKQMETELLKVERLESIAVLAGGIAHDFNNLLGGIFGYLDVARYHLTRGNAEGASKYLTNAIAIFDRAKHLTQQLLTFAKGGAPVFKTQPLGELVHKSISFALSGANVSPEFTIPEDLWLCSFDEHQMSQVFDNIAINARQAMPGGGKLEVTVSNVAAGDAPGVLPRKAYVLVSLRDYGTGIAPEHMAHIFDPFFTTKQNGSGLGLATCYSIVKRHGGLIEAASELDRGTTFHIYLPASFDRFSAAPATTSLVHKGEGTILIMDDEKFVLDVLAEMLQEMGYQVVAAQKGEQAIALVKQAGEEGRRFAAAILDLTVPGGLGGKEAVQALSTLDPSLKIIASSGYSEDQVMSNPRDYGFSGRLIKPYRLSDLQEVLQSVLKQETTEHTENNSVCSK